MSHVPVLFLWLFWGLKATSFSNLTQLPNPIYERLYCPVTCLCICSMSDTAKCPSSFVFVFTPILIFINHSNECFLPLCCGLLCLISSLFPPTFPQLSLHISWALSRIWGVNNLTQLVNSWPFDKSLVSLSDHTILLSTIYDCWIS